MAFFRSSFERWEARARGGAREATRAELPAGVAELEDLAPISRLKVARQIAQGYPWVAAQRERSAFPRVAGGVVKGA